jgi:hypothetical protein
MRYLGWLIGLLALIGPPALAEEHRWATEGNINGRPARLVLDTGVSFPLAMQRRTMADFEVELDAARAIEPSMEGVVAGFSKAARIGLPPAYKSEDALFAILVDGPDALEWDFDAIIGWPGMSGNRLHYSRTGGIRMSRDPMDVAASGWATFPMVESNVLVLNAGAEDAPLPVLIDTGWSGGVQLSPALWQAWRARNAERPHTLISTFSPAFGLVTMEQVLAERIEIGGLILHNVLVSQAPPSEARGSLEPQAVLGLAAFANHELLIDGPARKVRVAPVGAALVKPLYNRLGATFVPGTMAARVAPGSPAAAADVRDGDVLVAIDGLAPADYAAKLTTHGVWEQPAGTAVTLTLDRAGSPVTRRVVLKDFLDPPR